MVAMPALNREKKIGRENVGRLLQALADLARTEMAIELTERQVRDILKEMHLDGLLPSLTSDLIHSFRSALVLSDQFNEPRASSAVSPQNDVIHSKGSMSSQQRLILKDATSSSASSSAVSSAQQNNSGGLLQNSSQPQSAAKPVVSSATPQPQLQKPLVLNKTPTPLVHSSEFFWSVCDVQCTGPQDLVSHRNGAKHKKNAAGGSVISTVPPTNSTKAPVSASSIEKSSSASSLASSSGANKPFFCVPCGVQCSSAVDYQGHSAGAKHRKCVLMAASSQQPKPVPVATASKAAPQNTITKQQVVQKIPSVQAPSVATSMKPSVSLSALDPPPGFPAYAAVNLRPDHVLRPPGIATSPRPTVTAASSPSAAASASDVPDCAICLEPLKMIGYKITKVTGCGHRFHSRCLKPWMEKQKTCPSCRHFDPGEDFPSLRH